MYILLDVSDFFNIYNASVSMWSVKDLEYLLGTALEGGKNDPFPYY